VLKARLPEMRSLPARNNPWKKRPKGGKTWKIENAKLEGGKGRGSIGNGWVRRWLRGKVPRKENKGHGEIEGKDSSEQGLSRIYRKGKRRIKKGKSMPVTDTSNYERC